MARRQQPQRPQPQIDLEELLHGNPSWDKVSEFWKDGEFHEEHYLVAAIKKHLRTDEQRKALAEADISIEDMLNGRVANEAAMFVIDNIFNEWNAKLGHKAFGFSR
jgi:hypothetical protein